MQFNECLSTSARTKRCCLNTTRRALRTKRQNNHCRLPLRAKRLSTIARTKRCCLNTKRRALCTKRQNNHCRWALRTKRQNSHCRRALRAKRLSTMTVLALRSAVRSVPELSQNPASSSAAGREPPDSIGSVRSDQASFPIESEANAARLSNYKDLFDSPGAAIDLITWARAHTTYPGVSAWLEVCGQWDSGLGKSRQV